MNWSLAVDFGTSNTAGMMKRHPAAMSSMRSIVDVRRSSQPCRPAASARMPNVAETVTSAMSSQSPPLGVFSSRPTPSGSSTKAKGTMKAGIVYFQDCSVVL